MFAYPTVRPPRSAARADEPGSGRVPGARTIDSPRWPLASLASAARAVMLALALILAASVGSAHAQQPSASALATAKELITTKGAAAIFDPVVPGVIEQAKSALLRTNPMLSKDLNEVAAKLRADYALRSVEIVNDMAKLYATRFTEQELKDTLAFYKSPLGRKLLVEEPRVLDEGMRNAQTWANKLSEEVLGKIRAEMKKRGHDI
jgi:hypothetical protein